MLNFCSFVAIASIFTAQPSAQPQGIPALPAGINSFYTKNFKNSTLALAQKDYLKANQIATKLPDEEVKIAWVETSIPAGLRTDYIGVRNQAIALWQKKIPTVKFKWVSTEPDVRFNFAEKLPNDPGAIIPAGAKFVQSFEPKQPAMSATIALNRGVPSVTIGPREIFNEINFALATYFGMAKTPAFGNVNSRLDQTYGILTSLEGAPAAQITENLKWSTMLKQAIKAKKPFEIGWPKLSMDITNMTTLSGVQGDQFKFGIAVSNQGTAPMTFYAVPDCGCFRLPRALKVLPGQTEIFRIGIDSTEFKGTNQKKLMMFTNDPDRPVFEFPVKFIAIPRYEFISSSSDNIFQMPPDGLKLKIQLSINQTKPMKVVNASLNGREGALEWKDWRDSSGKLKGSEFTVLISPDISPGREMLSIDIQTDDPILEYLHFPFSVQKGIAIMPYNIYFGNIQRKTTTGIAVLSDPHRSFKVLSIKSDSAFLKAKIEPLNTKNTEYRVTAVIVDPKEAGVYEGNVIIKTDYPGQETITIPVYAKVVD